MHDPVAPTVTPVSEATVLDACSGRDLPRLGTVEQLWETDPIPEGAISERAAAAVDALALGDMPDGGSVAVGVGSRGITNLPAIVAGVVGELDARGYEPFVVPAMGSHGGATAEGQRAKLEALGVTAERVGCPIRPTMETVTVGTTPERGIDVSLDANAAAADGIVPINRVKQHTDFEGRVESGLSKMLVIGLGKQRGAKTAHEWAIDWSFRRMIPEITSLIVEEAPVVGGVALVEDQRDDTAVIEGIPPSGFLGREAELLETARELLPQLPFDDVDVLVVDRMGKDISGSGMDTNVIGRRVYGLNEPPLERPEIKRIYVRTLTEPSHGNAAALGLADFVGAELLADLDLSKTVINGLTASTPRGMRVPPPVETDRAGLVAALSTVGVTPSEELRVLRITDTMRLERVYASEALVTEARDRADLRVVTDPGPVDFDDDGSFTAPSPVDPEH